MDTYTLATIALFGVFFVLMLLRIPVSISLLLAAASSALIAGQGISTLVQQMVKGIDSFSLLAIPFFILMGEFMNVGGISNKIVDLANLAVGRFRGGLAYINCLDSMFFGGLSGSSVADVSSLGSIVIPMMKEQGYDEDFAVGLTVTTSCQAALIPPSHNMVIYALAANLGGMIPNLLYAGLVPGVLLGLSLMFVSFLFSRKYKFPRCEPIPKGQRLKIVLNAVLPMMIFVIIMGGIAAGIFTVTESAAVACLYTFLLTYFILRSASFKTLPMVLKNALKTLAIVLTLIATAKAFSYMMTLLHIPAMLTNALVGLSNNRVVILLIINLMLLVLGCFMDMAPLILVMTPILLPVVTSPAIGMSPIHFGVVMLMNLSVGLCTPPVGSALYVGCAIGKTPIERTSKNMLPLYFTMVAVLLLVTFIPAISLWLPGLMF
ncbi:MAG: TRAP transporter large permease [Christensenellales bacterium]|jgi:tripartite ATP-independent transporter DctM subunit